MVQDSSNPFGFKIDWDTSGYTEIESSTAGDLPFWGTSGIPDILPIGSANQFLGITAGLPAWKGLSTYVNLGTQTLGVAGSTISLTGLSTASYTFLLIQVLAKGNAAANGPVTMRFNNDSGSNYRYSISGDGAGASGATGQTALSFGSWDNTEECGLFLNVTNVATRPKLISGQGAHGNDGTFSMDEHLGVWNNSADNITRIDLLNGDQFNAGSTMTVWGIV